MTRADEGSHAPTRSVVDLDGEWTFRFEDGPERRIRVPCPWESAFPELRHRAGAAAYERTFELPQIPPGSSVAVQFDAVDYVAEVWIDGRRAGEHEGGYMPFEFPIEQLLSDHAGDSTHAVRVRVADATSREDAGLPDGAALEFADIPHGKQSWYSSVSGIWQSARVVVRPASYVARVKLVPDVDSSSVRISARLAGTLRSGLEVRATIGQHSGAPITARVPPSDTGDGDLFEASIRIPEAVLWSPDNPFLYRAEVVLLDDGAVVDRVSERFGMRKIEARNGLVWLNGKPLFVIGALDQAFYPDTIYTEPDETALRDQFRKAKELGLNLLRCHIKLPATRYLDLCDEMGLLVWYELPSGGRLSPAFRDRARQTLAAARRRDCNHASLAIVSICNEAWGIDLGLPEQRAWLADTCAWLKALAPEWLVVDNSPCPPNFHIRSDLDDYHAYFSIPDQKEECGAWIERFARREQQTWSLHGDAARSGEEPLLLSEFGNWGLPRSQCIRPPDGSVPYWFETGEGATRPAGVADRFEAQILSRAYRDYDALAEASQERQWTALKWQIEELRRHPQMSGYVITEFTDLNWECNGLLHFDRSPKVFHDRMRDVQAQDILIPRIEPRTSFWEGEGVEARVFASCFSGRSFAGGTLAWSVDGVPGLSGEQPVTSPARGRDTPVYVGPLGVIRFTAPAVPEPARQEITVILRDAADAIVATCAQPVTFAPRSRKPQRAGLTAWLAPSLRTIRETRRRLADAGLRVVDEPGVETVVLGERWDNAVAAHVRAGGAAVLCATEFDALAGASGVSLNVRDRAENGWWGSWCTSGMWLAGVSFPSLPDPCAPGLEYATVMPRCVLTGAAPEETLAGIYVGWLHNPAAIVARIRVGAGTLVVTTFDLLPHAGADPVATLLIEDLLGLALR